MAVPRGDSDYAVRFRIEGGRAGARLRINLLQHAEFIRRIFVDDGESSGTSGGGEGVHGVRVEDAGVGACAGAQSGDDFASVRVHDNHFLVIACGEEPAILAVHGYAGGAFAGRQRPAMKHFQRLGIYFDDLILVGNVDEDAALAVGHNELRLALELYRTGDGPGGGVNRGGAASSAIHDEDAFGDWFVGEGIGSFAGFHGTDLFQGFEVHDDHFAFVFIGRKAAAKFGHGQQAVGSVQAGDLADGSTGVDVQRVDMIFAADVEDAGRAIHGEIVPALGAGEVNRFQDVIAGWAGECWCRP